MADKTTAGQAPEMTREEFEKVASDSRALIDQIWAKGVLNGLAESGVGVPVGDDPASTARRNTLLKMAYLAQQSEVIEQSKQASKEDEFYSYLSKVADSVMGVPQRNAPQISELDRADLRAMALDADVLQAARNLEFLQNGR
jgi:hypothetical protein